MFFLSLIVLLAVTVGEGVTLRIGGRPILLAHTVAEPLAVCLAALAPAADLASVVSEETFLFVEVTDPAGVWADFEQSGLRDMIRGMPQGELQFRMVAGLVQQVALQQLGVRLGDFAATHAPLLFAGPGIAAGTPSPRTVSFVDIYPTLCELCGTRLSIGYCRECGRLVCGGCARVDGVSLVCLECLGRSDTFICKEGH